MVGEKPTQDTAYNAYWGDLAEVSEKFGAKVRRFDDSYWSLGLIGIVYWAVASHSPKNRIGSKWERLAYADYDDKGEGILTVTNPAHRLRIDLIAQQMEGKGYTMVLKN